MLLRIYLPAVLALSVVLVVLWNLLPSAPEQLEGYQPFPDTGAAEFADLAAALWRQEAPPRTQLYSALEKSEASVYMAVRRKGRRLGHDWSMVGSVPEAMAAAVSEIREASTQQRAVEKADVLEIVLAYDFNPVDLKSRGWSGNIHRGVRGLEIRYQDKVERYSPTYMLATNRDYRRLIELFRRRHKLDKRAFRQAGEFATFEADQWLVNLSANPNVTSTAVRMERGNNFVPIQAVTGEAVEGWARLATDWLDNNLNADGRMTYKFWPSTRRESQGNNMIRQWMATVALVRAAKYWQDDELMQKAARNIDYNIKQFYRQEKQYGFIEYSGKAKLGAMALAALAMAEHPQRARWAKYENAIQRTIDFLWQEDGSFITFFKPEGRNDIQNFYPGEALLYWASLYEENRDKALLDRIMASFRYYRAWHLNEKNRNPAFTPWHTQAYFKVWKITRDEELKSFIFQMNDWLIDQMQQWEAEVVYRDALGRFYNPRKRYGPPHASSTGVYLEGLIDAYLLAKEVGDKARSEKYRTSIRRGLRSAKQLQFVDDVDMFYIPEALRDRVRGGMRTTVYNNEIRCDNVQHNLMGVLKIIEGFEESDFVRE